MRDKAEILDLMTALVTKFDLEADSKHGIICGDDLIVKMSEFAYKATALSLEERKAQFKQTLMPYLDKYGREMLNEFYFHWTATKQGGWKMKVERETSWDLPKRLHTWSQNAIKFRTINLLNGAKK